MAMRTVKLLAIVALACLAQAVIFDCPEEQAKIYDAGWQQCNVGIEDVETLGMNGWDEPRGSILSTYDFNVDGVVDDKDVEMVKARVAEYEQDADRGYEALFDTDGDCDLDAGDVLNVIMQKGKRSLDFDQIIVQAQQRYNDVGDIRGQQALFEAGLFPIPIPLKGHGVHWFTPDGLAVMQGFTLPDFEKLQGANIPDNETPQRLHGVFWPGHAVPMFRDENGVEGTFDFPISPFFDTEGVDLGVTMPPCTPAYWGGSPDIVCKWQSLPSVRFANPEPKISGDSRCESWHTHGGLCMFVNKNTGVSEAHQYTTFDECVAMGNERGEINAPWVGVEVPVTLPSGDPFIISFPPTLWANFWMVHFWIFDLNPLGLYAGWHPTVNLDADSESTINEFALSQGRSVEPWFAARPGIADVCCRELGKETNACCQPDNWRVDQCCSCDQPEYCDLEIVNCHSGLQE